jgi:methyltransferase (TIGR00027 family)
LKRTALVEREAPRTYGGLVCRTRFIDDGILQFLEEEMGPIVIIGAGLDTRACRLDGMADVDVWEVDLPSVQQWKRHRLRKVLGAKCPFVRYVPLDLNKGSVALALQQGGFGLRKCSRRYLTARRICGNST